MNSATGRTAFQRPIRLRLIATAIEAGKPVKFSSVRECLRGNSSSDWTRKRVHGRHVHGLVGPTGVHTVSVELSCRLEVFVRRDSEIRTSADGGLRCSVSLRWSAEPSMLDRISFARRTEKRTIKKILQIIHPPAKRTRAFSLVNNSPRRS